MALEKLKKVIADVLNVDQDEIKELWESIK